MKEKRVQLSKSLKLYISWILEKVTNIISVKLVISLSSQSEKENVLTVNFIYYPPPPNLKKQSPAERNSIISKITFNPIPPKVFFSRTKQHHLKKIILSLNQTPEKQQMTDNYMYACFLGQVVLSFFMQIDISLTLWFYQTLLCLIIAVFRGCD